MEAKPTGLSAALSVAYRSVIHDLKYTHQRLASENEPNVNFPTLRRIRSGQPGKVETDRFYLELFLSLLDREYRHSISSADTSRANQMLRKMREILLLEHGIDPVSVFEKIY